MKNIYNIELDFESITILHALFCQRGSVANLSQHMTEKIESEIRRAINPGQWVVEERRRDEKGKVFMRLGNNRNEIVRVRK